LKAAVPSLRLVLALPGGRSVLERIIERAPEGPDEQTRGRDKFTILAEAIGPDGWRNVVVMGADPYGLTAELLSAAALRMAEDGYDASGVLAPVQAAGLDLLRSELEKNACDLATYQSL
jgi:short subunit dehydrogenase-like uncharacterized protein